MRFMSVASERERELATSPSASQVHRTLSSMCRAGAPYLATVSRKRPHAGRQCVCSGVASPAPELIGVSPELLPVLTTGGCPAGSAKLSGAPGGAVELLLALFKSLVPDAGSPVLAELASGLLLAPVGSCAGLLLPPQPAAAKEVSVATNTVH